MAASSQISQNKRGRDEYLNSGLDSPGAKRINSGTLGHDCYLMAFLDKIDSVDNNSSNPEDTHTAFKDVKGEMSLNSPEDQIVLKTQTDNNVESTDGKSSTEQMASNKQADRDSEVTSPVFDIEDFPYYNDFCGEVGFFVDHFTADEIGILQNHIYGFSNPFIRFLDAVHGDVETTEVFYGSLWDKDIWH